MRPRLRNPRSSVSPSLTALLALLLACGGGDGGADSRGPSDAPDLAAPTDVADLRGEADATADAAGAIEVADAFDAPEVPGVEAAWREVPWPVQADLRAAWGRDFEHVLVVGDAGTLLRFNGRWSAPLAPPTEADLLAVDGAHGTVALAGAGGTLLLSTDGAPFQPVATGVDAALRGVVVTASDEVVAVGDAGTILRVRPGTIESLPSNTTASLQAVWGGPDGDLAALDAAGGVFRLVSGVWLRTQVAHGVTRLSGVAGPDLAHLLIVGEHGTLEAFDGLAWTALLSNDAASRDLRAVRVLDDGEAWAAGAGGVLLRRAAGAEADAAFGLEDLLGPTLADADLAGLVVERQGGMVRGVLAGTAGALLVSAGDGWRDASARPTCTVREAARLPDGSVLVVGDGGLVARLVGDRWSALPLDEARDLDGLALAADGVTALVGTDRALLQIRLDTLEVDERPVPTPGRVRAVSGDVLAADGGVVARVQADGNVVALAAPAGLGPLYAAAACSDGTTWVAGERGALLAVRGEAVTPVAVDTSETLRALACTEGGVLAAGDNGVVVTATASSPGGATVVRREPGVSFHAALWQDGTAWLAGSGGVVATGAPDDGLRRVDLPTPTAIEALCVRPDGRPLALGVDARAFAWGTP